MDAMEAILRRRSIREFTSETITEHELTQLLRAAMYAPSAGNERPWEFVVITDRGILAKIPKIHPHSRMLERAPAAILVCGDPTKQKYDGYWVQDCSAATQNILIAGTAMGLGTVWLGVYPLKDRVAGLQRLLNIPDHVIPMAIVAVGRPAENKDIPDRYDKSRIHKDHW